MAFAHGFQTPLQPSKTNVVLPQSQRAWSFRCSSMMHRSAAFWDRFWWSTSSLVRNLPAILNGNLYRTSPTKWYIESVRPEQLARMFQETTQHWRSKGNKGAFNGFICAQLSFEALNAPWFKDLAKMPLRKDPGQVPEMLGSHQWMWNGHLDQCFCQGKWPIYCRVQPRAAWPMHLATYIPKKLEPNCCIQELLKEVWRTLHKRKCMS